MTKDQIIKELQSKGIAFNPQAKVGELEALLTEEPKGVNALDTKGVGTKDTTLELLKSIKDSLSVFENRLSALEGRPTQAFKNNASMKDIEDAQEMNKDIDPKIVAIVEEILGTDFKIDVKGHDDRPGFLFSVVVPPRLSDTPKAQRPKRGEDGLYIKDEYGNTVMEEYTPEDRRSRQLGSADSYGVIREHCERVRGYIVNYYQKTNQPMPEFKYKSL